MGLKLKKSTLRAFGYLQEIVYEYWKIFLKDLVLFT